MKFKTTLTHNTYSSYIKIPTKPKKNNMHFKTTYGKTSNNSIVSSNIKYQQPDG